jgi:hypothetical protein
MVHVVRHADLTDKAVLSPCAFLLHILYLMDREGFCSVRKVLFTETSVQLSINTVYSSSPFVWITMRSTARSKEHSIL